MLPAIERLIAEAIRALAPRPTPRQVADWIVRHRARELRAIIAGIARMTRRRDLADPPLDLTPAPPAREARPW